MITSFMHRNPIRITAILLIIGMAVIFANMVFLLNKMNEEMAENYVENYIHTLNEFQSQYSAKVIGRVKGHNVQIRSDYMTQDGAIPFPATFSIELAESLSDPKSGIKTRLYSDYPFTSRKNGGPRDEFESYALIKLRFSPDKTKPFVRYEKIDGRYSLRYAIAVVMEQSCVNCHNTHPDSPKKDWKVGDVRGVRSVTFPLDVASQTVHKGWLVTLAVMLSMTISGLVIIYLVINALRSSIETLSKTNIAFNRFVPHQFLQLLNKKNILDVQLNDNIETQMTVLFSDIRSFTELSENMTPEENFKFVNDYLKVMSPIVSQHHGFIDKYIGDAIMALFNNADDAMNAAIQMQKTLTTYNMERLRSQKKPISIGIGLHKGTVRLGTIGEQDRMDGTVISDAVNLASRIEGLTRFYGVQCLVSEATYLSLKDPSQFLIRFIDKVKVKGKHVPIAIYEVFNGYSVEIQNQKLAVQGVFEEATKLYAVKEFAKALVLFEQILAKFPDDLVSQSYLSRCNHYLSEGVDDSWEAVLQLETK